MRLTRPGSLACGRQPYVERPVPIATGIAESQMINGGWNLRGSRNRATAHQASGRAANSSHVWSPHCGRIAMYTRLIPMSHAGD